MNCDTIRTQFHSTTIMHFKIYKASTKMKRSLAILITATALFATLASPGASAGEVEVVSSNGLFTSDITVTGTTLDDNVLIRSNLSGEITITGRQGTTINFEGSTSRSVNVGFVSNASISMRGGDDMLVIAGGRYQTLDIRLGRGNDRARFLGSSLGVREGGTIRGGRDFDIVSGGINSLELRSVERTRVFASALDRDEAAIVTTDTVDVVDGADLTSDFFVGETFVFPADFTGSATINGFDSHGELGTPQDLIDVSAIDADVTQPGNQAFTLVIAFNGNPGELVIPDDENIDVRNSGLTVAGDTDGDAVADFTITLDGFQFLQAIGPWFNNFTP